MYQKTHMILAVALLIAAVAAAQEWLVPLEPTPLGTAEYDASGVAKKTARGKVEQFALRIVANCPDDTIFVVRATDLNGDEFDVGTITMLLNSGSLVLRNNQPSRMFPLGTIQSIAVYERRGAILTGNFAE